MKLHEEYGQHIMNTYARYELALKNGSGCYVSDFEGKKYLDMLSGIACCPLGHNHPAFKKAVLSAVKGLTNTSNLYYTEPQLNLAKRLSEIAGLEKCFFSNSGTEANEAAIKLALAHTGKNRIIACKNGFHGRTIGSLALTYEEKYRKKYESILPKFGFVDYGNADALRKAIDNHTAAVILEPIQGEAGVVVPPLEYLKEVRELCDEKGVLMIVDEVQTGNGRTGTYFAYQSHAVIPDIVTTAKGLANGLPIGATLCKGMDFQHGDHGSTFGGNSFVSTVALEVVNTILNDKLMENAIKHGNRIKKLVAEQKKGSIVDIRGKGLMIGIELKENAKTNVSEFQKQGILLNVAHEKTLRLLPPLIIGDKEVEEFATAFRKVVL